MAVNDREVYIAKTRLELAAAQPKWVANWSIDNTPENSAPIPQTLDGTKHIENIDQMLRPKINFTFNFQNEKDFAEAERIFVLGTFVCNYFQPAIKKRFTGCFMLDKRQVALFLMIRGKYSGVANYSITAESKFTYETWGELENLAESDDRF